VDHPARIAAGPEGEVVTLEYGDLQPAQSEVARDARAVDASTDDRDVDSVDRIGIFRRVGSAHGHGRGCERDGLLGGHEGRV
jgi:hypothetical protein